MGYLENIGIAILCALGLVVFLVIMWFVIGMFLAMRDVFFKNKRNRNFISHDEIIKNSN